jgi:O-antigen/teichoic acid export membrane protein
VGDPAPGYPEPVTDSADGGKRGDGRRRRGGRKGAALGARMVRHSSIHFVGLFGVHAITFASAIVIANYLGRANFGQYSLLLFFAGLIALLFKLLTKRGTYKQLFGGDDDDDDDDDDEDLGVIEGREKILGNGIALTALLIGLLALLMWPLGGPLSDLLLGTADHKTLILWAAAAGGFEGMWNLTSNVVRLERRPVSYVILSAVRPILILGIVVAFVIGGAGLEGAIAATAIATAASVGISLVAIRRSYHLDFEPAIARSIVGQGFVRTPIIVSYWTVAHADKFIVSRFVSHSDLGIYSLASMTSWALASIPAAFFKAWRPMKRSMTFAAVDDHYGVGVARGAMLTYLLLVCISGLLGVALFAPAVIRVAPSFEDAAPLIPLLAAGALMPYILRGVNKAASIQRKRRNYIAAVAGSAIVFVGACVVLVQLVGLSGAPLAMIIAFSCGAGFLFWRSQRGQKPLYVYYRSLAIAALLAIATGAAYYAIDPSGLLLELILPMVLFAIYVALAFLLGAVPKPHRDALVELARTTIRRHPERLDPADAIRGLEPDERAALRMAIADGRPAEEIGQSLGGNGATGGERVVRALRRLAEEREPESARPTEHDARIGEYLLSDASVAVRDARARKLLSEGVESADLHALEAVLEELERAPSSVWADGRR